VHVCGVLEDVVEDETIFSEDMYTLQVSTRVGACGHRTSALRLSPTCGTADLEFHGNMCARG
jgi:hypothetical protein